MRCVKPSKAVPTPSSAALVYITLVATNVFNHQAQITWNTNFAPVQSGSGIGLEGIAVGLLAVLDQAWRWLLCQGRFLASEVQPFEVMPNL